MAGCDSAGPVEDGPAAAPSVSVQLTTASGSSDDAAGLRSAAEAPAAAETAADIEEAVVTISGVELLGEEERFTISGETQEIDLLDLGSGAHDLALSEVPAGEYDRLLLRVTEARLTLSDGTEPDLKVPSEKIRLLLPDFEVEEEGDEAQVTASFDVGASFVKVGRSGMYLFKPTVRAASVEVNGEDRDENVEVAGAVTAYTEGERVAVEGFEFAITENTEIDEELALEEGQSVELEGARAEGGDGYVAQEVEARSGEEEEEGAVLEAPLGEVRPDEGRIVLLGAPFAVNFETEFDGFSMLSELESSGRVEVAFTRSGEGEAASGPYTALEVESESSSDEGGEEDGEDEEEEAAEVKGHVTSAPVADSDAVAVEGLAFAVTGGTETGEDGGLEAIAEGDVVELEATYTSDGTLVATEIEEEEEEDAGEPAELEAALGAVSSDAVTLLGARFAVTEDTELDGFDDLEELEQGGEAEVEFAYDADAGDYRALKIEGEGDGDDD
jgi:hypothetical protein